MKHSEKDFCKFVWEEFKVQRMKRYLLYTEFGNSPIDIHPVYKEVNREYDYLNIDWKSLDLNKSYQELGKQLFNQFN